MSSYSILKAITVNAEALSQAGYVDEALPFIHTLDRLFDDLQISEREEKAAPTAPTVEAAKENPLTIIYRMSKPLSSFVDGTHVITPYGYGTINGARNGKILVEMDDGGMKELEVWELGEDKNNG